MVELMLRTITERFHLKAADVAEFRKMKISGMNFHIWAFEAEGLGHVSAMTASGFFGLMKMDTLIINPTQKDMPLFSYDRVHAMGNDTLIYELYDTILGSVDLGNVEAVKTKFNSLPNHDLGQHWYDSIKLPQSLSKKGKKGSTPIFDACTIAYLEAFLDAAETAAVCERAPNLEKTAVYVEGLLQHGGPSTDVFIQGIGQEKTEKLFRHVLFGTLV